MSQRSKMSLVDVLNTVGRSNVRGLLKAAKELRQVHSKQVLVWQLNNERLGKRLRELRIDSGWSLRELACLLRVSAPFLSDCELGHRTLGISHLMLYLHYCGKGRP